MSLMRFDLGIHKNLPTVRGVGGGVENELIGSSRLQSRHTDRQTDHYCNQDVRTFVQSIKKKDNVLIYFYLPKIFTDVY